MHNRQYTKIGNIYYELLTYFICTHQKLTVPRSSGWNMKEKNLINASNKCINACVQ